MKLFVAGYAYNTTEKELEDLFERYGQTDVIDIVLKRDSDEPRGFAFVEMPNDWEAERAIRKLNGKCWHGRRLKVCEARESS